VARVEIVQWVSTVGTEFGIEAVAAIGIGKVATGVGIVGIESSVDGIAAEVDFVGTSPEEGIAGKRSDSGAVAVTVAAPTERMGLLATFSTDFVLVARRTDSEARSPGVSEAAHSGMTERSLPVAASKRTPLEGMKSVAHSNTLRERERLQIERVAVVEGSCLTTAN
jgi:hypothetical protein